jgi:predicted nucleotidyltransferase
MTRRVEHGPAIVVDDQARARVAAALDRTGVAAAYLFGSQARGSAGPLSDVDLAVWADPALGPDERLDLRLELIGAAEQALGTDQLDLVILDDASPVLRHRAWRDGQVLVDRDPLTRVRQQARALVEYLDTQPLRDELDRGLRRRLADGSFGRR